MNKNIQKLVTLLCRYIKVISYFRNTATPYLMTYMLKPHTIYKISYEKKKKYS